MSDARYGGMRPITDVITLEEARARLAAVVRVVRATRGCRTEAAGRVLAATSSPHSTSPDSTVRRWMAMRCARRTRDGDAGSPVVLTLAGISRPGSLPEDACVPGACIDIATGAPVPTGADAVVMVERTRRGGPDRGPRGGHAAPAHSPRGHDVAAASVS